MKSAVATALVLTCLGVEAWAAPAETQNVTSQAEQLSPEAKQAREALAKPTTKHKAAPVPKAVNPPLAVPGIVKAKPSEPTPVPHATVVPPPATPIKTIAPAPAKPAAQKVTPKEKQALPAQVPTKKRIVVLE